MVNKNFYVIGGVLLLAVALMFLVRMPLSIVEAQTFEDLSCHGLTFGSSNPQSSGSFTASPGHDLYVVFDESKYIYQVDFDSYLESSGYIRVYFLYDDASVLYVGRDGINPDNEKKVSAVYFGASWGIYDGWGLGPAFRIGVLSEGCKAENAQNYDPGVYFHDDTACDWTITETIVETDYVEVESGSSNVWAGDDNKVVVSDDVKFDRGRVLNGLELAKIRINALMSRLMLRFGIN